MKEKQKLKNENAITLVALIVTIIVLIILAGISINMILGENGIITMAKKAKENIQLATEQEQKELNELYEQMESQNSTIDKNKAEIELAEFKKVIAEAITNKGIETSESDSAETMAENISKLEIEVNLAELTEATATADKITVGYTAYVNGEKITGTRPAIASVQSGSRSQNIANGASVTWDIKFDTMFDTTPKVTWSSNYTLNGGVTTVDRSHFVFTATLVSGSWSTSEYVVFNWTATVE